MTDIVVIFCCAMLGFVVAKIINKQLYSKEKMYCYLMNFAVDMRINVQYAKQTLSVFLDSSSKDYKEYIQQLLSQEMSFGCNLSNVEQAEITEFIVGLSANNSSSILHHLDRYIAVFESQYNKMHLANKLQFSANTKVGILLGAVLALLLI